MKLPSDFAEDGPESPLQRAFPAVFGAFLGLALLKFNNPPIMEKWVTPPKDIYEIILGTLWPVTWAYVLLALVAVLGLSAIRRKIQLTHWLAALPLAWFLWECLASLFTVSPELTKPTLEHFCACVICFYLGFFPLASASRRSLPWFWVGILSALLIVIAVGWQQQFGGLEETRHYFFLYIYPKLKEVPPDYLKKIQSSRIFSTLFYPNALAGALLLLLPAMLEFIWQARERFTEGARLFLVATVGFSALACLYWSGSKGGWLLMLILTVLWLLQRPFSLKLKRALVFGLLVAGLAGFFWKYSGFFQKGATSVSARFDYWHAAFRTTLEHPCFGTGPGTFSISYAKLKRPESEMARLAHNDYLQQASDSGVPGLILYAAIIVGCLLSTAPISLRRERISASDRARPRAQQLPKSPKFSKNDPLKQPNVAAPEDRRAPALIQNAATIGLLPRSPTTPAEAPSPIPASYAFLFALWLGVLGWALQGLLEFGLYIPGLAWSAFAFLGYLVGRSQPWNGNGVNRPTRAANS